MFTEEKVTKLELLNDGRINVVVITHYLKDGMEIGQDNWGCCLEPNKAHLEHAKTILDDYYYNIVKTAWTEDVMARYAERLSTQSYFSGQQF